MHDVPRTQLRGSSLQQYSHNSHTIGGDVLSATTSEPGPDWHLRRGLA